MRIVITRREPLDSPDGVNIFIVALAQAFMELGHDVLIVVGSLSGREQLDRSLAPRMPLDIIALSETPLSGARAVLAWIDGRQKICRFRPDLVIHTEAVPIPLPGFVVHVVNDLQKHGSRLAPLRKAIRKFAARNSDGLVATTNELQTEVCRELQMARSEIALIPKCVDLPRYEGMPLGKRERAIFHSGTLPYKNPVATLQAFKRLADPSVRLYIAGEMTNEIAQAMDEIPHEIRSRVRLLGDVDCATVRALHARTRVSIFPSKYTVPVGSGTVMEAIASGVPILGSPELSTDVLVHRFNGIVSQTDAGSMSGALRELLDDDEVWTELSDGAQKMKHRFDAQDVARRYIGLCKPSQ